MVYTDPKFLEVLKLLDELLASENPTVRELIDQAILVQTMENPNREREFHVGPFQQMFHEIQSLRHDVNRISGQQSYYNYPSTPGGTYTINTSGQAWTGGVGAGPYVSSPTTFTIGNIAIANSATSVYDTSWFSNSTMNDDIIDWDKYFATIKTEADASDPKPAEDFYSAEKTETALTVTKLQELLDKLKY